MHQLVAPMPPAGYIDPPPPNPRLRMTSAKLIRLPQEELDAPPSHRQSRTHSVRVVTSRPIQAPLHVRRDDEAEARRRPASLPQRQVGNLQRSRRRSTREYEDPAHLDRSCRGGRLVRPGRAKLGREVSRKNPNRRSGRRPPPLVPRRQALRLPVNEGRRFTSLDRGLRWRRRNSDRDSQVDVDRDRGERRTLVARWQEHSLYVR